MMVLCRVLSSTKLSKAFGAARMDPVLIFLTLQQVCTWPTGQDRTRILSFTEYHHPPTARQLFNSCTLLQPSPYTTQSCP